jgi:hypothetical protein
MRNLTLIALLAAAPSLVLAQTSVNGSAENQTSADVRAGHTQASADAQTSVATSATVSRPERSSQPSKDGTSDQTSDRAGDRTRAMHGLSVEGRTQAEAAFQQARQDSVPEHPIVAAMLEAQAKGATEQQILTVQQQTEARLKASKEALVHGGRSQPSDEEVSRGAHVLARGATQAQLEGMTRRCSSDRSLVVAFETLAELTARGVPVSSAVAEVGAQLDAHASDDALRSLGATLAVDAATNTSLPANTGIAAGTTAGASVGATAGNILGGTTATGGLAGTVTGGLGR